MPRDELPHHLRRHRRRLPGIKRGDLDVIEPGGVRREGPHDLPDIKRRQPERLGRPGVGSL